VLERLVPSLKSLGGKVGVAIQAVVEIVRPGSLPALRAHFDGRAVECGWAIVGNSRCYAGPYHATPAADPFAAELEVVLQQRLGRLPAVSFALGIPSGSHVCRKGVLRQRVERLRLESPASGKPVPYQVDGDFVGHLPVEVWIDKETLLVRMPEV
jgi:diacylglycerol kinase family enzyme